MGMERGAGSPPQHGTDRLSSGFQALTGFGDSRRTSTTKNRSEQEKHVLSFFVAERSFIADEAL